MACPLDAVAQLLNLVFRPLVQQVAYVVEVGERVKDLEENMADLNSRSSDVQRRIREAERHREQQRRCSDEARTWLQNVTDMDAEVSAVRAAFERRPCKCFGRCSGDVYASYKIGRRATKKLARVKDLFEKGAALGSSGSLTVPAPSPPGQEMPGTSNLVAVEPNLRKALGYLADGAGAVGIVGMGGVGKTTLLKRINNELVHGGSSSGVGGNDVSFDHVIWVVVSKDNAQPRRLQEVIATRLQLPLGAGASFESRHDSIFNFLNGTSFVLLLDDVWQHLDLDAIGIPDRHRTVVFTTRSEEVCGQMEARKNVIKVECLKQEEAWHLFKHKVGGELIDSSTEIRRLAREVSEECKGLPLALITVGRAMSAKTTVHEWQHALTAMKSSRSPTRIHGAEESLFRLLKCSYDNLPDQTTRQCFLCCSLFPEDCCINEFELIECFLGHGLIDAKEFGDHGEAYDYGHTLIGILKSACLLESARWERVKMHDVLRDMALWIACDCGKNAAKWVVRANAQGWEESSNWESSDRLCLTNVETLPEPRTRCANMSTLVLLNNARLVRIPEGFFRHFPVLTYLDLSWTRIRTLPDEVTLLVELRYLNLMRTMIRFLNMKLSALVKLKHLILRDCLFLKHIPYGLISNLPVLQVLDLYGSTLTLVNANATGEGKVGCWKDDNVNKGGKEAMGVDHLEIPEMTNTEELKHLKGRIKALGLNLEIETISGIRTFFDDTSLARLKLIGLEKSECLHVGTLLEVGKNIRVLRLSQLHNTKELSFMNDNVGPNCCFGRMKELNLEALDKLNKITWKGVTPSSIFPILSCVSVYYCHGLRDITWAGHLPNLKYFAMRNCRMMQEIISTDEEHCRGEDDGLPSTSAFPKLRQICLENLSELRNICSQRLDCPLLDYISVAGCPKLKRLPFTLESQMANKKSLDIVVAEAEWWEGLEWGDDSTKSYLEPFLVV